ncbi:hypothetical protein AKJ09_00879 [Labilithrix luteola]|uniref:PDZ domain-containing protein n=1 Tax=Labilithrix luteola TaxID=1391654 RepID=A0A0K1PL22_9BACT|nr:PDZ domain-containing protein [Labilithrix luteola]AKU94215.1 hypothetical protein AKJ09_00879 [Labilithrix luteola]
MRIRLAICLGLLLTLGGAACGHATGSIGAILRPREGRLYVVDVPSNMTGARAGLEPGDEIVAIDGREVHDMTREDVINSLRGDVGSTVTLRIRRDDLTREVKVERGPFAK